MPVDPREVHGEEPGEADGKSIMLGNVTVKGAKTARLTRLELRLLQILLANAATAVAGGPSSLGAGSSRGAPR